MEQSNVKTILKNFILTEFASGEEDIDDNYPLMANGILDSIDSLRLVSFVEAEFNIMFAPHEITAANLGSINALADFIKLKRSDGRK